MSKEKQIEEMACAICGNSRICVGEGVEKCLLHPQMSRYAINAYREGYRKQAWISVEERLPHWSDGKVLVFTKYGFSICERTTSNRWMGKHANWITHWMPLPEPPKGE